MPEIFMHLVLLKVLCVRFNLNIRWMHSLEWVKMVYKHVSKGKRTPTTTHYEQGKRLKHHKQRTWWANKAKENRGKKVAREKISLTVCSDNGQAQQLLLIPFIDGVNCCYFCCYCTLTAFLFSIFFPASSLSAVWLHYAICIFHNGM